MNTDNGEGNNDGFDMERLAEMVRSNLNNLNYNNQGPSMDDLNLK